MSMNEGVTKSERVLARLCRSSFLNLWTYLNPYRDQKATGADGDGKEICDALVVFENKVILFSDKEVRYKNHGDPNVAWKRWHKRAITDSKTQLDGGLRWIVQHPERVFVDKKCTQRIPIPVGSDNEVAFYRVVVANGVSQQIADALGGSGSLMIQHSGFGSSDEVPLDPYVIHTSAVDSEIYHVFDESNLTDILKSLDTVSDFVAYLESREWLFRSGVSLFAPGEEELLAQYLTHFDLETGRGFEHLREYDAIAIEEGAWVEFRDGPLHSSALNANQVSRIWDQIIETFSKDLTKGELQSNIDQAQNRVRQALALMASESRFGRRTLGECLHEVKYRVPSPVDQYVRVTKVTPHMPTTYVLYALRQPEFSSREEYIQVRRNMLYNYCLVAKWKHRIDGNLVGIGLDRGDHGIESFDLVHFEPGELSVSELDEARALHQEMGLLTHVRAEEHHSFEYPYEGSTTRKNVDTSIMKGHMRNRPCPCGSGRKFKICCGRRGKPSAVLNFVDL